MAKTLRVDEVEEIAVAGVRWRPLRRTLGVTGFGINAYAADAGRQLIEEHDETGDGAGRHEELYLVIAGRATFTVGGKEVDAPAGTLVFLDDPTERRAAVAVEDGTTAVVVGGRTGTVRASPWEHAFYAARTSDPAERYRITAEGLAEYPDNPNLHFDLACHAAQMGEADRALEHLRIAAEGNPSALDWAATDTDLDPIRSDPRFPATRR